MKRTHSLRAARAVLLAAVLLGLLATPAGAATSVARHVGQRSVAAPSARATLYVTLATLRPTVQRQIDGQLPGAVTGAINSVVGELPQQDQGWAAQMASALLQPTATLTGLATQREGLAANVRLSLYQGDPHALDARTLITFSVASPSTIAVSARPLAGSPALFSGPLATLRLSSAEVSGIATTPGCGDAAVALGLQFPIQGQASAGVQAHVGAAAVSEESATPAYIELPASTLTSIGASIGDLPINSTLTAKNIRLGVQGSNLLITSDIYASLLGKVGTAVTTVAPAAARGNLAAHVLNTNLNILNLFTFPYNNYNLQIQQSLNSRLNGALAGAFSVAQAATGPNARIPCVERDSLLLSGNASLGQL
jgi:hypothetical protein